MISLDEALAALEGHALARRTETIPIEEADGRVLAEPVVAKVSRPPEAVSAMDGYAVRLGDVREPGRVLRVIGEAAAGSNFGGSVGPGEAVRIFTGSTVPEGADHIVIQEETTRDGDRVTIKGAYEGPAHIRAAGLDFTADDALLPAGTRLGPAALALVAAANHGSVTVLARPRVGILANGNELRAPGSVLKPGEVINANAAGLGAMITRWGGEAVDLGIAADSRDAIRERIDAAEDIDLFLPVGGASVGDHDHMQAAFADAGFEKVFAKVAIKPGKPTWFSVRGDTRVLGLPGNPASALVCAWLFAQALLAGNPLARPVMAQVSEDVPENGPREHFMRARIEDGEDGMRRVTPAANQDSSLLTPFIGGNALLRRLPGAAAIKAGDIAPCFLLDLT